MNLAFPDARSLADLGSYAARAKVLDEDGAIRLVASGSTLAAYVGVLPGRGLMGEGAVLGLRVMALAEPAQVDVTVPLGAVTDRTARVGKADDAGSTSRDSSGSGSGRGGGSSVDEETSSGSGDAGSGAGGGSLESAGAVDGGGAPAGRDAPAVESLGDGPTLFVLPPVTVHPQWAALAPPRSGWEPVAEVSADIVNSIARQGISEVAQGSPEGSGSAAVATLRHRVWTTMSRTDPALPAGLALAAYGLGFVTPGEPLRLFAHGRWTRLTSSVGHALMR